ncbi:MAG: DUF2442 domain-containing protein [Flavobacteriales bacterium]|nr:DUF2442 domain-containing protein [Flavobacteriales bacterium]
MTIPENVFIKSAKYLGDYRIALRFTDGRTTELDFHDFLAEPSQNPMVTRYLDVTLFKAFVIQDRADIVWGDWEMCFPFAALYAGDLAVDSLGNKKRSARKPVRPLTAAVQRAGVKPLASRRKAKIAANSRRSIRKTIKRT